MMPGEAILKKMHNHFAGQWYGSFTFTQQTEQYRNDSLIKTSTWHEAIVFPDKFRIDFGPAKDSNAVIYLGDSVYSFKKGILVRTTKNKDDLTFLLGGMYFNSFDSVRSKMKRKGYDLSATSKGIWNNKTVYIIGVEDSSRKANQLWVDSANLFIVKFIHFEDGQKEEGVFRGHKQFGKAWSETGCDFYVNGKLVQKEDYLDCKANVPVDLELFDPARFKARK